MSVRRGAAPPSLLLLLALGLRPAPAPAQTPILYRGLVVAADNDLSVTGALLRATRSGTTITTDRAGRFALWVSALPDTVVVAAIGWRPDTLVVVREPREPVRIELTRQPVAVSDLIVTAPAEADVELRTIGRWEMSGPALRTVPPAVEPDVFRALALVPAVRFSTPLSARPLIRGYDAGASSIRIDGFEVLNLYHIGRAFSAFPAEAAADIAVTAAPQTSLTGSAVAGVVDITGRTGEPDTHGGAALSLASLSTWLGGGDATRLFGAARAVHFSAIGAATGKRIPYDFQDLYASAVLEGSDGPRGRVTVFGSRDDLSDVDDGRGMAWNNLLLGARWQVGRPSPWAAEVWASGTRFAEDVVDVPARRSRIDVRNRFARLGGGVDLVRTRPGSRLALGFGAGLRSIDNQVIPIDGGEFQPTDTRGQRLEAAGYAEWGVSLGGPSLQLGARADVAGSAVALQPRVRLRFPVAPRLALGVAMGRTAQLYHLVTDPQAEPDLAFYDFWLNAGEGGIPTAQVDHVALELDGTLRGITARASLFGSRGRGLVELRPTTDQTVGGTSPFRVGRSRVYGLELQAGIRGSGPRASSVSLSYVWSHSERRWDNEWVPWTHDRHHLVRLMGTGHLGPRWTLFGMFEAASGAPFTPIAQVIFVDQPNPIDGVVPGDGAVGRPVYVYGPEHSRRGGATARADLGFTFSFTGPWRSRAALGFSVINASFGPVAPLVPVDPDVLVTGVNGRPPLGRVQYERLFDLPAIPTLTARLEF